MYHEALHCTQFIIYPTTSESSAVKGSFLSLVNIRGMGPVVPVVGTGAVVAQPVVEARHTDTRPAEVAGEKLHRIPVGPVAVAVAGIDMHRIVVVLALAAENVRMKECMNPVMEGEAVVGKKYHPVWIREKVFE